MNLPLQEKNNSGPSIFIKKIHRPLAIYCLSSSLKMLRTQISSQNQCMLTSDSDTESDDLSKYFSTLVPPRYTKGKGVEEETRSQSAKEWKEDLGNFVILSLHLLCLISSIFISILSSVHKIFIQVRSLW